MAEGTDEMNHSMIKIAQRAGTRGTLLASLIRRYGEREKLSWGEIARQLRISEAQLAKLALCRIPRRTNFSTDVSQIADYVDMNRAILQRFVQHAGNVQRTPTLATRWQTFWAEMGAVFTRRTWALGVAALVLVIIGAVAFAQPRRDTTTLTTLVVSEGEVIVQVEAKGLSSGRDQKVIAAGKVVTVSAGDEISLGAGSKAQLRLYDGSTVDLFENTTVQVSELRTNDSIYRVSLNMLAGKTVSRVVRLIGAGDAFKVSTPSSTASVRGTIFTVQVVDSETTYIACDEGTVYVETGDQEAEVPAGTAVMAVEDAPLEVKAKADVTPPGPPDSVPGHTPEDVPGNGNPPDGSGPPPGLENRPETPPGQENRPETPPGLENRPETPPGQENRPETPPGLENRPESPPGQGNRPDDADAPSGQGQGPPERVPGHTPRHVPGRGTPPEGDGPPPGLARKAESKLGNRPESPPGLDNRPEVPPGLENRPETPPGQENRPETPPGQENRPTTPPGQGGEPPGQGDVPPGGGTENNPDSNAGGKKP